MSNEAGDLSRDCSPRQGQVPGGHHSPAAGLLRLAIAGHRRQDHRPTYRSLPISSDGRPDRPTHHFLVEQDGAR